jgi:hypothetical protein
MLRLLFLIIHHFQLKTLMLFDGPGFLFMAINAVVSVLIAMISIILPALQSRNFPDFYAVEDQVHIRQVPAFIGLINEFQEILSGIVLT